MSREDIYYAAMLARDNRFDGKFFVGVKTTGIYCRPICPARPLRKNVDFFPSAAAAERAGFRPCLRCRPESAPLSAAWVGKSAVVQRALRWIAFNPGHELNEDEFAEKFGLTARHLRRLFVEEIGLTPNQVRQNSRLNFARKLITETSLPMTHVALSAGFSSLRRFNDAFKMRFHRAPREIRKRSAPAGGIQLALSYRPPFDFESLLNFYRSHRAEGIENVTHNSFERVFRLKDSQGYLRVTENRRRSALNLEVRTDDPSVLFVVAQKVRSMFDLDSDPLLVANSFQANRFLDSVWRKNPGMRVARGWDPFEMSIRTILGQFVSIAHARNLVRQLLESEGREAVHPVNGEKIYLFPDAKTLSRAKLAHVGTTATRKATIREFARRVADGRLDLFTPRASEEMARQLVEIPGIGPWSAEYIGLRALGNTDAFPATDLILKRAVDGHQDVDLESVRPWRSYAAIYLWKHYADTKTKGAKK